MFVRRPEGRRPRRGVVLILILAMLGLLALIGVAFATFSSQAQVGARKYAEAASWPTHEDVMDFALSQIINDTHNPLSAIRFHSLKRDMYGSDATNNGILTALPGGGLITIHPLGTAPNYQTDQTVGYTGYIQWQTNIPVNGGPGLYGLNMTRWIVKMAATSVGFDANANPIAPSVPPLITTYEVLRDDLSTGVHILTLSNPDATTALYNPLTGSPQASLITPAFVSNYGSPIPCALDGRFLHAFNGPGLYQYMTLGGQTVNRAMFSNFLINSTVASNNPNGPLTYLPSSNARTFQMDEDYDAPDLDNWFLGLQSADGTVVIPSYHRPGIVSDLDWTLNPRAYPQGLQSTDPNYPNALAAVMAASKVLRPRAIDGHDPATFPNLIPNPVTGQITYDVDNTGDGVTDAVWLDLGYPIQRDANGKMFKPLFAITILGLNGRMPLNTAGNLQGVLPANLVDNNPADQNNGQAPILAYAGSPTYSHASHIGYSANEINPLYALQNANDPTGQFYGQLDNAGVAVNVTQLRNILAGNRPQPSLTSLNASSPFTNQDTDAVLVNGVKWYMPNGIYDGADTDPSGLGYAGRQTPPVAGRWGESEHVPQVVFKQTANQAYSFPLFAFNNFIRAGRSNALALQFQGNTLVPALPGTVMDGTDDDFDATDYGNTVLNGGAYTFGGVPEMGDVYEFPYTGSPAAYYNTGAGLFPSERIRRFVKPIDPSGNGRLMGWRTQPGVGNVLGQNDYGTGADGWGRVGHLNYFRPAGLPPTLGSTNSYNFAGSYTAPTGSTGGYAPWTNGLTNFGLPVVGANPPAGPEMMNNPIHGYDAERLPGPNGSTGNVYDPQALANGNIGPFDPFAPMPYNSTNGPNGPVSTQPTFTPPINSIDYWMAMVAGSTNTGVVNGYPGGSFNHDEADEMNLYRPGDYDAPFGPHDLEWLYRKQDVDGASLSSRLEQLAPVSFLNPLDGATRRNLFSIDTWDLNTFAFASDNPGNAAFRYNDRGSANVNSLDGFSTLRQFPYGVPGVAGGQLWNPNLPLPNGVTPQMLQQVPTPNIAHRDRKINLNFPLPVSTSPVEPVRQKWIRETYQFLKAILPPEATDTPQELAQLSQYVVNIIDFRDPDGTPTRFVNTDLVVQPPTTAQPALVMLANRTLPPSTNNQIPYYPFYDPNDTNQNPTGTYPFLVQYGMEYSPVAINEVLAYSFIRGTGGTPTPTGRLFVELVNTLVDGANTIGSTGGSVTGDPSDVDLTGWDLVLYPGDDYSCRPDPITGELPPLGISGGVTPVFVPLRGPTGKGVTPDPTQPDHSVLSLRGNRGNPDVKQTGGPGNANLATNRYYYVLANASPDSTSEQNAPTTPFPTAGMGMGPTDVDQILNANTNVVTTTGGVTAQGSDPNDITMTVPQAGAYNDPMASFPSLTIPQNTGNTGPQSNTSYLNGGTTPALFCWAYLRRPINPLDVSSPKVVVDSFRFTYVEGGGRVKKDPNTGKWSVDSNVQADKAVPVTLFSTERIQPYRGGHGVPYNAGVGVGGNLPTTPAYAPLVQPRFPFYGWSEQTNVCQAVATYPPGATTNHYGLFNTGNNNGTPPAITNPIYHSLREHNSQRESWDFFPFHDRDFQSVAELLLVPGCPPGLFTKLFTEFPPPLANPIPVNSTYLPPPETKGTPPPSPSTLLAPTNLAYSTTPPANFTAPHTYPYLPDNFYYWPYGFSTDVSIYTAPVTGGPSGTGWHKMLGIFEVPSSANGAIGPVGAGSNFDWFRQDVRPGQLNLNLVIDEEVFFGLMDDLRLNLTPVPNPPMTLFNGLTTTPPPPFVVTGINAGAGSYYGYPMNSNRGFTYWRDPFTGEVKLFPTLSTDLPCTATPNATLAVTPGTAAMKQAFSDFLKFTHGGSGNIFAFGAGQAGSLFPAGRERPFHDLTFPDIDQTVMRPAFQGGTRRLPGSNPRDAGLKYSLNIPPLTASPDVWALSPPPIPIRRMFQIPDASITPGDNAAFAGDQNVNTSYNLVGNLVLPSPAVTGIDLAQTNLASDPTLPPPALLGPFTPGGGGGAADRREHPAFRTEWLQKVMNLTTVRTHQYACWVTVGFFEVRQPGDPQHIIIDPNTGNPILAPLPDILGAEVGALEGKNVRYRNFCIIDRTKATGFNQTRPGDFNDLIIYERRIE